MQASQQSVESAVRGGETLVRLDRIGKRYDGADILNNVSLSVRKGEFVSILGPSGSGKSTLFNIITGLTPADRGELQVSAEIGYMQQKDLLLPWKSVLDNVALPLRLKGLDKKEARSRADAWIDRVGLRGYENRYPAQLSGGMKQRASFLRTFLASGELMLLDEPFGALDSMTKSGMQTWLLEMQEALGATILFITHDIEEAIFLSDRIYVLSSRPGYVKEERTVGFGSGNKRDRLVDPRLLRMKDEIRQLLSS